MCISPISIINPTRFVSKVYRQPYKLEVPCGKCPECQSVKALEWQTRLYYEFRDLFDSDTPSYAYFDTLTYDDSHIPRVNDVLGTTLDDNFTCFNYKDFQDFIMRLRKYLSNFFDVRSSIRYFVCSEYGTSPNSTHRPHLHLLLFVRSDFDPLRLSLAVSNCWRNGRTDGSPWRDHRYVLEHNVIRCLDSSLPALHYVAKYVSKSCVFQSVLDHRIDLAYYNLCPDKSDLYRKSCDGRRLLRWIRSSINQFHKQSQGFGLSLLRDLDVQDLMSTNSVQCPQFGKSSPKLSIPLPTYFKRKLFYDLCKCQGKYVWNLNDNGKVYKDRVNDVLIRSMAVRYHAVISDKADYSKCLQLADYVLNKRGYVNVNGNIASFFDVLQSDKYYNYVTSLDYDQYHKRFVSEVDFHLGYPESLFDIDDFVKRYVYIDLSFESLLSEYNDRLKDLRKHKILSAHKKEVLRNKYKFLGMYY